MSDKSKPMKPSRYLDNDSNDKWEWHNDGEKVEIVTMHDHPKPHVHKADVTKVPIGEMIDNPDPIIGEAHRNSPHYYEDGTVKPPKNNNGKDSTDMSSKEHKAFCERLNPSNYGNSTEPTKTTMKKSNGSEDENKGQQEKTLPDPKNTKNVQKMKSDMKTEPNRAKDSKQNTVVKAQSIEGKSTDGKSTDGKGGNVAGGKGEKGGNGGIGTGGKGGNGGHSGGPGGGHGGGPGGGHGGGPGGGSGGHGGGHGGR